MKPLASVSVMFVFALLLAGLAPAQAAAPATLRAVPVSSRPATQPTLIVSRDVRSPEAPYLLYLPGISGYRGIDRRLVAGLTRGLVARGDDPRVEVYDWPAYSAGLGALLNLERNRLEARRIAEILTRARAASPHRPIYLVGHSGGTGLAAFALELLPGDFRVDQLLLLAPALSPQYDLTPTLLRVSGRAYAFTSDTDPVLGSMTRTFGTIDRVQSESAGLRGFVRPDTADAELYRNVLVPMPYRPEWDRLGNPGDHIGPMAPAFAEKLLAPLLVPSH